MFLDLKPCYTNFQEVKGPRQMALVGAFEMIKDSLMWGFLSAGCLFLIAPFNDVHIMSNTTYTLLVDMQIKYQNKQT